MISVLIADDSFLMRRLLQDILSTDPEIRVVGTVSDGEQVLAEVGRLKPDVITMDLEMPKLSGLAATKRIVGDGGHPIILMVSAFEPNHAQTMLECLKAGAFDCILKPSGPLSQDLETIKDQIIAKVKAAGSARKKSESAPKKPAEKNHPVKAKTDAAAPKRNTGPFPLIVIGASTGGPPILEELLKALPASLSAAVLIVQHMPEHFTAAMAERFDKLCALKVKEAEDGEVVKPGTVLIAPGNWHMRIGAAKDAVTLPIVKLSQDEPRNGLRPSIDVLMVSAAKEFRGPLIGVLLTGMGSDGAEGLWTIGKTGGITVVQSPETCAVSSMVHAAMEKTSIDHIANPADLPGLLTSLTHL